MELLSLLGLTIFVWFVAYFLVNAKKDELEKNNEKVQNVLSSLQAISENLFKAGTNLSDISDNESASAEELAATTQELLASSNLLDEKTNESMSNLNELTEWESVVADNVEKVESTSKDLIVKAKENEQLLGQLQTINTEVSASMITTVDVAQKISAMKTCSLLPLMQWLNPM